MPMCSKWFGGHHRLQTDNPGELSGMVMRGISISNEQQITVKEHYLQRVDMGIAMCHFELTAHELGLQGSWIVDEPKLMKPEGAEYTVTWMTVPNQQLKKES